MKLFLQNLWAQLTRWLAGRPESFTTGFSAKKTTRERVGAAVEGAPRHTGRKALLAALAVLVPVGGLVVWQVQPAPAQTNTLTLCYVLDAANSSFDAALPALTEFYKRWPDVKVELQRIDATASAEVLESQLSQLRTQIMAGKGPDVILGNRGDLIADLEKQCQNGIFADLTPYIQAEPETVAPLNQPVLAASQKDGKQYYMPLSFWLGSVMAHTQVLEQYGIAPQALSSAEGYLSQIEQFFVTNNGEVRLSYFALLPNQFCYLFPHFADLKQEQLPLTDPLVQRYLACCKAEAQAMKQVNYSGEEHVSDVTGFFMGTGSSYGKKFVLLGQNMGQPMSVLAKWQQAEIETVETALYGNEGQLAGQLGYWAAIVESSKNKQNAWRLIQCMLSENWQKRERILAGSFSMLDCRDASLLNDTPFKKVEEVEPISRMLYYQHMDLSLTTQTLVTSTAVYDKVLELFKPYFEGTASYEACAAEAQKYWRIYRSE